jgi:2-methylcitrate dehydratase PrpD
MDSLPFAGAVSSAKLLKLAPEEMLNALSNKKQLKNNP